VKFFPQDLYYVQKLSSKCILKSLVSPFFAPKLVALSIEKASNADRLPHVEFIIISIVHNVEICIRSHLKTMPLYSKPTTCSTDC